jgi:hypothetical protein
VIQPSAGRVLGCTNSTSSHPRRRSVPTVPRGHPRTPSHPSAIVCA